jgi:hypothetical protein
MIPTDVIDIISSDEDAPCMRVKWPKMTLTRQLTRLRLVCCFLAFLK